jgi:hypothetical protein
MEQGLIHIQNDALLGTIVHTKDMVETSMVRTTARKVGSVSSNFEGLNDDTTQYIHGGGSHFNG